MRGFLPHTEEDLREMLETVGVGDLDELFSTDPGPGPDDCSTGGAPGPLALLLVALLLCFRRRRR